MTEQLDVAALVDILKSIAAAIVDTKAVKGEAHLTMGQHILSHVTVHGWSKGRKVDQYIKRCVTALASYICKEADAVSSGGNSPRSNLISLVFKVSHAPTRQTGVAPIHNSNSSQNSDDCSAHSS